MPPAPADFRKLLTTLAAHRVEHIVVGGVAAVVHGAPVTTFDLDIVPALSPENVAALATALRELGATYRERPDLAPDEVALATRGHKLLMTTAGPLDVLGAVGAGESFAELEPSSVEVSAWGTRIRVLDLPSIIRIKEAAGREKDLLVLPLLRRTLEERGRAEG